MSDLVAAAIKIVFLALLWLLFSQGLASKDKGVGYYA